MSQLSSKPDAEDDWSRVRLIFAVEATRLCHRILDSGPSLFDTDLLPKLKIVAEWGK